MMLLQLTANDICVKPVKLFREVRPSSLICVSILSLLPAPNLCICTYISVFFEPYSSSVPPCISVPNQRAVVRRL